MLNPYLNGFLLPALTVCHLAGISKASRGLHRSRKWQQQRKEEENCKS